MASAFADQPDFPVAVIAVACEGPQAQVEESRVMASFPAMVYVATVAACPPNLAKESHRLQAAEGLLLYPSDLCLSTLQLQVEPDKAGLRDPPLDMAKPRHC